MAGHKHGSQDVSENQKVFEGFIRISATVIAVVLIVLVFLAIVGT